MSDLLSSESHEDSAPQKPAPPDAYLALLEEAVKHRATDLHIDPLLDGYQIRLRIDGIMTPIRNEDRAFGERVINQFKTATGVEPGTVFTPLGVRKKFDVSGALLDCRLTLAPCISGPKLAIRILDPRHVLQSITELGLAESGLQHIHRWLRDLNGMFLVSGPTASGKTTTLYALLHELAEDNRHIVTIEDPVEYEIDGINQIQVDHRHGLGFEEGMKTILRLDPDHAMIGELRSSEGAEVAVAAAIAGHVMLATVHARDAVSAISALRNFDLADHQIATALGVVVNQRLVRKLCPHCREAVDVSTSRSEWFESQRIDPPSHAWRAVGCERCSDSGYFGRTGLFEVWHLDESDYEMLLAGADEQSLREKLERQGHETLWHDAAQKIELGVTNFDEVQRLGLGLPWD